MVGVPLAVVVRTSALPVSAARSSPFSIALYDVGIPFLVSRFLFILITILDPIWVRLFHMPRIPPTATGHWLSDLWYRWDVQWYLRVATDGYRSFAYEHQHQNLAFFPLYPLLIHMLLLVWPWAPVVAAMLIANCCFAAASYYLYRVVALDFGRPLAQRVVWLLALFPTSLFFFSGYSEGLFLLCLVLCFWHLRLGHWWWAGLWGGMAAATRPLGIILVVPFALVWYQAHVGWRGSSRQQLRMLLHRTRSHIHTVLAVSSIPAGLGAYMGYLWLRFGDPMAFSSSQRQWHRTWAWPWQSLSAGITRPLAHMPHLAPIELHAATDTIFALVCLAITVRAVRTLPGVYTAFLCCYWIVMLSTPALLDDVPSPLISVPRFLATAFPLLIFLAGEHRRFWASCAISVPLLVVNTAIFVSGGWVA